MPSYVCLVGGVNIDISGTPFSTLNLRDSNPGKTTLSLGGVARNIAENLSLLGIKTEFITALGNDTYAEEIQNDCKEKNISLTHSIVKKRERTSSYLCINDENGDMHVAISDMKIYNYITPKYLISKLNVINKSRLCVIDTNIPGKSLNFLMDSCTVPIFMDTVSISKTEKIKNSIHNIHTLKPNINEAEILSDMKIKNNNDLKAASDIIHNKGVKWLFISLGTNGVYYSNRDVNGKLPAVLAKIVSTTGAGDSFLAGAIWAFSKGEGIENCAKAGLSASSICVGSPLTVSKDMSVSNLEKILKNHWR